MAYVKMTFQQIKVVHVDLKNKNCSKLFRILKFLGYYCLGYYIIEDLIQFLKPSVERTVYCIDRELQRISCLYGRMLKTWFRIISLRHCS